MSLRFCDSFNHYSGNDLYNNTKWTSITGSQFHINAAGLNISLGTGRFGSNSLRYVFNNANYFVSKTIDSQSTWVLGFALKISPNPGTGFNLGGFPVICALYDSSSPQVQLYFNSDLTLSISRNTTNLTNSLNGSTKSSKSLSLNSWNYIEFQCTINSSISSNSCKLIVNGETWINLTSGQSTKNTSNSTANQIILGTTTSSGGQAIFDYSDLYVCDGQGSINNSPLGDVRVDCLFPKAAGGTSSWTGDINSIKEQFSDGDNSFISSATTNAISTFTLPPISGSISGVQHIHTSRKTDPSSARQITDIINTHAGSPVNLTTSYALYSTIYETDPSTSAPWTTINEIGIKEIT